MTWTLDGINISNLAYNVKSRAGGWTTPGKVGSNIRVPNRHGAFWTPSKVFDEGQLTLSMWAVGCNEDGTLPVNEDAKKKVLDNLDQLTSLFGTTNRLLTLRKHTGSDVALINELSNPTLIGTGSTGYEIAHNYIKNPDRKFTTTQVVSRNLSTNPFMKGRNSTSSIVCEDLYPDPGMLRNKGKSLSNSLRGYFYPIDQNTNFTNNNVTPYNGWTYSTGTGTGRLSRTTAKSWASNAQVIDFNRHVYNKQINRITGHFRMRLNANATVDTQQMRIIAMASSDNVTWTQGTPVLFTLNKDEYTDILMRPSDMPVLADSDITDWYIKYRLLTYGASSWNAGNGIDISKIAYQEAPFDGNPWANSLTTSHFINASNMAHVVWYPGDAGKTWSVFRKPITPEWEVVNSGSTSTTAPYARAFANNDGSQSFTVFGGTTQTFRRSISNPSVNGNVSIWGRCTFWQSSPVTVRVVRRTGSEGSYVYTTLGTISVTGTTFCSPSFAVSTTDNLFMEVVVPKSDSGMEPSISFHEMHVSNGVLNTKIESGVSRTTGPGSTVSFEGEKNNSTVSGVVYPPATFTSGICHHTSEVYTKNNVNWSSAIGSGYIHPQVPLTTRTYSFPAATASNTCFVRFSMKYENPIFLRDGAFVATSGGTVTMTATVTSATNTTRDVVQTFTPKITSDIYTHSFNLNEGEKAVSVSLSYANSGKPISTIVVNQLHIITDNPLGSDYFTGNTAASSLPWNGVTSWVGSPWFSSSSLSVSGASDWTLPIFDGFDTDKTSIKFKGTTLRVQADLSAGSAYIGYRRGPTPIGFSVSVQTQGMASPVSLGSITTSVDFVQNTVTLPQDSTYVDFIFATSSQSKSANSVFAVQGQESVFPIPNSSWIGMVPGQTPGLTLPTHPESRYPSFSMTQSDREYSYQTGHVQGWSGKVLAGGYLPVPASGATNNIFSGAVKINGGYCSASVKIQPTSDAASKLRVAIQGATAAEYASGSWQTMNEVTVTTTAYQDVNIVDVPMTGKKWARIVVRSVNTPSPITRTGIIGIVTGACLVPSPMILGSNYPGYFVGAKNSSGQREYRGDVRQCFVEVVESISMESMAYGSIAEFNVNMVVPGSFWEDVYDTQQEVSAQGGSRSGYFVMSEFDGSTAPMADIVFEVTPVSGSLTSFNIMDRGSGNYIRYSGPAKSKVVVDARTASVVDGDGVDVMQYVPAVGSSTILSLSPYFRKDAEILSNHPNGCPILDWTANVPIRIKAIGRRKYLIG